MARRAMEEARGPRRPLLGGARPKTARRTQRWDMLGFGACRAAYLCCFNALSALVCAPYALPVYWLCAAAVGAALAIVAARIPEDILRVRHGALVAASSVLSVLGVMLIVSASVFGLPGGWLPVVGYAGAVVAGVGCAGMHVLWGLKLSRLAADSVVVYVALGFTMAGVVLLAVNLLGNQPAFVALVLTIIALFTLNDTWSSGEGGSEALPNAFGAVPVVEAYELAPSGVVSRSMCAKLCAMMFVVPFAYHFAVMTFVQTTVMNRDVEGVVVAVLALGIVVAARRVRLLAIFKCVLPVVVAAYLFMLLLPPSALDACIVVAGSGLKLSELFVWALLVSATCGGNSRRRLLMALGTAAMFGGRLAAYACAELLVSLPWYSPAMASYLLVVVLVAAVILMLGEHAPGGTVEGEGGPGRATLDDTSSTDGSAALTFEDRCARVAQSGGLTCRETEIFTLLATGRSQAVIAERLGISEGTAHVHIVHVYRKLGIHGQQELISLVEDNARDTPYTASV